MECAKCGKVIPLDGILFCPFCGGDDLIEPEKPKRKEKGRGNGHGSVYQRTVRGKKQSTWTATVTVGWRLPADISKPKIPIKRSRSGFATKREALDAIPELRIDKPKTAPNLLYYWETYKKTGYLKLGKSKQTAYRIAWEKRLAQLGNASIDALTVQRVQDELDGQNLSFYQFKDCRSVLAAIYKLAFADGYAQKELPSLLHAPQLEEKEQVPFSDIEQSSLWKLYESGDIRAALPLLMIYTGMMPGEVQTLRVDQIDLEKRLITGAGLKTKVRKETPVVIAEYLVPVVQDLIDNARPDGYLWIQSKDDWYQIYYDALKAAGCRELKPYSCRHTTATALAVTENIAPQTIRKVMRWSTSRMLDRYAHPDTSDALAAVDRMRKAD